jgi:hypothetical protein
LRDCSKTAGSRKLRLIERHCFTYSFRTAKQWG